MRVNLNMEGLEVALKELDDLAMKAGDAIEDVVEDAIILTHELAVKGINSGPATGRVYQRGNIVHQASAPGQYPMADRGGLAPSVSFDFTTAGEKFTGTVGTNLVYGLYLETGTSRMAARPWLLRSIETAARNVANELRARLK
ncbi:hypothetical protein [Herbaspirillum sp.]|uniref:hypothetical protein n=1 Tax=Herbaspirillum sp. TaxID=1890675 RepID=UPI0025862F89|nr:hypothetical protein [Herbaspirillum sp.]MCP3947363.1 hypothetical protein [Herbaspirillum sp.]